MLASTLLQTPQQAGNLFSQQRQFPKQRHSFVVRFVVNGPTTNAWSNLTFAVKSTDRPTIQPHSEELSQYNQKRQVYTGYKLAPLKMTFYDTSEGIALGMWNAYSRHYFGDFAAQDRQTTNPQIGAADVPAYRYDATFATTTAGSPAATAGTTTGLANGFGFTAGNDGWSISDAQFFFKQIVILHIYTTPKQSFYDSYTLVNPRIVSWAPDELDYEAPQAGTISAEFAFEAALFNQGAGTPPALDVFNTGQSPNFVGVTGTAASISNNNTQPTSSIASPVTGVLSSLTNGFASGTGNPISNAYRMTNSTAGGALALYGNYAYGSGAGGLSNLGSTYATGIAANPGLAALVGNLTGASTNLSAGVPAALYNQYSAQVNGALNGPGSSLEGPMASAVIAASLGGGVPLNNGGQGLQLAPDAYGLLNAQGNGSTQYGFNDQTASGISTDTVGV